MVLAAGGNRLPLDSSADIRGPGPAINRERTMNASEWQHRPDTANCEQVVSAFAGLHGLNACPPLLLGADPQSDGAVAQAHGEHRQSADDGAGWQRGNQHGAPNGTRDC